MSSASDITRRGARTRRRFVGALLCAQVFALVAGVYWAFTQVRRHVVHGLEETVGALNGRFASHLAGELDDAFPDQPDASGPDIARRMQAWIESNDLPAATSVAIVDEHGTVLCHSDAAGRPGLIGRRLRDTLPAGPALSAAAGTLAAAEDGAVHRVAGRYHVVASAPLGDGMRVVLSQPDTALATLSASVTHDLGRIALTLVLLVCALSGLTGILVVRRYHDELEGRNEGLEAEIAQRVSQSLEARNALIFGLAKLADYRDTDTGTHLERIGAYAEILSEELRGTIPVIDDHWIARIKLASSLHDIGKVGIPDAVLLKPGPLTHDERRLMQQHTLIGADTLIAIRRQLGADSFVDMAIEIALQHHERWDGKGYPFGLAGSQIALSARIIALADFYDAVTSERVYKRAMSHEETLRLVRDLRGSHFDPDIADAFLAAHARFEHVRGRAQARGPVVPRLTELAARYLADGDADGIPKDAA